MKVFIAGALSSKENPDRNPSQIVVEYLHNVHEMCRVAGRVRKLGHTPFVPALDLLLGVICGDWGEWDYRGISDEFLDICDAVLVISWSWGVKREVELAKKLCIPIYYTIEELEAQYGGTPTV